MYFLLYICNHLLLDEKSNGIIILVPEFFTFLKIFLNENPKELCTIQVHLIKIV